MPGWARSTPRPKACPPTSWLCCARRSPTTGSTTSTARRRSRRRATGCTSPRSARQTARAAVVAILERRLEQAGHLAGHLAGQLGHGFREALDHLVAATDGRDAVVADLAREVRYHYFDEPVIAAASDRVYAEMGRTSPRSPRTRRARTATSASRRSWRARGRSPLCSPHACATPSRPCSACSSRRRRGATTACARSRASSSPGSAATSCCWRSIPFQGRRRHLAAAYVDLGDVGAVAAAFADHARHAARRRSGRARPLRRARRRGPDARRAGRDAARARLRGSRCPRRCIGSSSRSPQPERGRGMSAIDTFTFRHQPEGLVEDEVVRGMHPMMGHRLALWRLENFALERLVSAEDIYAFHGVAHANAKDERLFALAEVRDLTPVRDEQGRVVALPELERILVGVLETIRGFQARRRAQQAAAVEPHPALRVAGRGSHPRGDQRGDAAPGADDPRPRDRARARRRAPP